MMSRFYSKSRLSAKYCLPGELRLISESRCTWRSWRVSCVGSTVGRSRQSDTLGQKVGKSRSRESWISCRRWSPWRPLCMIVPAEHDNLYEISKFAHASRCSTLFSTTCLYFILFWAVVCLIVVKSFSIL